VTVKKTVPVPPGASEPVIVQMTTPAVGPEGVHAVSPAPSVPHVALTNVVFGGTVSLMMSACSLNGLVFWYVIV
jgi:hypothetical protein